MTERDEIQALRELVQQRTRERDALRQAIETHKAVNADVRPSDRALYKALGDAND